MIPSNLAQMLTLVICLLVVLCYMLFQISSGTVKSTEDLGLSAVAKFGDCNKDFDYKGRHQEDSELIEYIRTLLKPPSVRAYHLNSPQSKYFSFEDHCKFVDDIHGPGRRDGFFVEAGGFDGESGSLPLFFEREKGFTGVLIEANPINYKTLLTKERKAYALNAAVSPTNMSGELYFTGSGQQGHLTDKESPSTIKVKTFPMYSILKALGVDFVDVFCIDIEGSEYKALKTIPWDKMRFGVVTVEFLNIPEPHDEVVKYMEKLGYRKALENNFDWLFVDPNYEKKFKQGKR